MDLQLTGKVAVIPGGSGPIGRATAVVLAQEGAQVVLTARDVASLDAAVAEVKAARGAAGVPAVRCNEHGEASLATMADEVVRRMGGIDILVYCAAPRVRATVGYGEAAFPDPEGTAEELNVKVWGGVRCSRAVLPHMKAKGWGRIVLLTGSNYRNSGSTGGAIRNAAILPLAKNMADEFGQYGINVTAVSPGAVLTEKTLARAERSGMTMAEFEASVAKDTAIRRMVTAEEVAWVIAFLCSPKGVSISGDVVAVTGGSGTGIYY